MSLPRQLYKLQQLDLELQMKLHELSEVNQELSDDRALVAAESRLSSYKEQLEDIGQKQKNCDWELGDLQEKIRQIDGKLYSGKTKDPKELVNLEKEIKSLKGQIRPKEDILLVLMGQMEEMDATIKSTIEEVKRLKLEWEQKQVAFGHRKNEIETILARLKEDRVVLVQQLDSRTLKTYERIRLSRGQAVTKVEKGKCQGCHITIPTSQWQKIKAGELIQCNSCSRILYVE